jgi:SAM-dependent methyltransferase
LWAKTWDDLFEHSRWGRYPCEELVRFVARHFYSAPDRSTVRVLEIGCGPGPNLWYLAREGFSAVGLDGSAVALDRARRRFAEDNLTVELHQGDATKLPFADRSFDLVLDVECFYANTEADTSLILDEVYRVLKPGGRLYSKTFMTGMTGSETGVRLEGSPNTFVEMKDGPLQQEGGLIRLMDEDEIPGLYGRFSDLQVDYLRRSSGNRAIEVGEWIITGRRQEQQS